MRRAFWLVVTVVLAVHAGPTHSGDTVAARYETTFVGGEAHSVQALAWYFLRTARSIESARGENAEIWQRSAEGRMSLQRIYHGHRTVVEYAPAELAARQVDLDWDTLGGIVPSSLMAKLGSDAQKQEILGATATLYSGVVNGDRIDLWWLKEKRLPAILTRTNSSGTYIMRLTELRAEAPADWPLPRNWPTETYRLLDAADLGDMEHDPMVKSLLRGDGQAAH